MGGEWAFRGTWHHSSPLSTTAVHKYKRIQKSLQGKVSERKVEKSPFFLQKIPFFRNKTYVLFFRLWKIG
ncbi:MAG: hypothetical protein Q3X94_09690, partial [Oscillospiraceae bacterium]|nr:hypothetical protein [Oscillospiraceae bacterium]